MKKLILLGIIMVTTICASAQMDDLIVTTNGDSIACEILEVNDSEVIFIMNANGYSNVKKLIDRNKITEYKYDVIQKDAFIYKPGTSLIIGQKYRYIPGVQYQIKPGTYSLDSLQKASSEELDYYLYKARNQQKTGRILNIVGLSTFGASLLTAVTIGSEWGLGVVYLFFPAAAGLGTLAVGLPINLTGKERVNRINSIKNNAINDVRINLQPCAQYNFATQNYQPGITFSINF